MFDLFVWFLPLTRMRLASGRIDEFRFRKSKYSGRQARNRVALTLR
mgnify:FL=1